MKTPLFIPSSEIPRGFIDPARVVTHPNGVQHSLNSLGYRSAEFTDRGDYNILTIGCSYAFGWCLRQEQMWSEIFRVQLASPQRRVVNWNLSLPGVSNDYISRMVFTAVPILRPDLVLVAFSQPARAEHWSSPDEVLHIRPTKNFAKNWSLRQVKITKHFNSLQNEWNDQARLHRNYQLIDSTLKLHNVPWLYTFACVQEAPPILPYLDQERFIGDIFSKLDLADDGLHPGTESNLRLAQLTWSAFTNSRLHPY